MKIQSKRDKIMYYRGYYAGYRRATIDHLGGKCEECGTTHNLSLAHKKPLNRNARTLKDIKNLDDLKVLCKEHHPRLGVWKTR